MEEEEEEMHLAKQCKMKRKRFTQGRGNHSETMYLL